MEYKDYENKERDIIIDELNRKIRKNMRKSDICNNLTLTGGILSIAASGYVINCVTKTPGYPGAFAVTGSSLVGIAACFGIECNLNKKFENNIKECVNILHGYALEDNKVYSKKESIKK